MENQHRHIQGYRDLSADEIAAMNGVKDAAREVGELLDRMAAIPGIDLRALAIARTELQTGFMWATRAVAKPGGF